ncbi:homeodomain-interacting protein kinase 1-like [Thalassophryne amazonica]|uniref:homeodomain-interacting protein kinase 1-like n=1 Tax=Thalassophryne amazonica TaxID=390379 RepID=UPI001470B8DB|nr:homeodomain-interacting protein kinase 1-like [Thalassophryne amazonica]
MDFEHVPHSHQNVTVPQQAWLHSSSTSYLVLSSLGQGTFGKVSKCMRMDTKKVVAVKVLVNKDDAFAAMIEVANLRKLKKLDPNTSNIVQWNDFFIDRNHICLEFELLDMSLQDFMELRKHQPLPLQDIRFIIQQLATALQQLDNIDLIHSDIKMENIVLVDHRRQGLKLKLIDFGLACDKSDARLLAYIQTRPYRAPEILLGLPFTAAIDIWSVGCVAAHLFTGSLLYPGTSEYDMMRYIVECPGQPPDDMLDAGLKTKQFFKRDSTSNSNKWRLRKCHKHFHATEIKTTRIRKWTIKSLDELQQIRASVCVQATDDQSQMNDQRMFLDLLKHMLHVDGNQRITPHQLLEHPFVNRHHREDNTQHSSHAWCRKKSTSQRSRQTREDHQGKQTNQAANGKAVSHQAKHDRSLPTCSSTLAPHDKEKSSYNAQQTKVSSGIKRKLCPEDDEVVSCGTSGLLRKSAKVQWVKLPTKKSLPTSSTLTPPDIHQSFCNAQQKKVSSGIKRKLCPEDDEVGSCGTSGLFRKSVKMRRVMHPSNVTFSPQTGAQPVTK